MEKSTSLQFDDDYCPSSPYKKHEWVDDSSGGWHFSPEIGPYDDIEERTICKWCGIEKED